MYPKPLSIFTDMYIDVGSCFLLSYISDTKFAFLLVFVFIYLFLNRGMPLHRVHDRNRKWRRMEEDESIFVYREGTLDQAAYNLYHFDKNISTNNSGSGCNAIIRNKVNNAPVSSVVSLKDVIVI